MNKHSLSLTGLIASSAIAAFQPAAHAASFTAQDAVNAGCVGQTTCTVNGFFSLNASTTRNSLAPVLTEKTVGGVKGLGIDSSKDKNGKHTGETGNTESFGEIDVDELLGVKFKRAGVLHALDLSFLYKPGSRQYGDDVFEVALATADGKLGSGTLTVTGESSAIWSLGGTVTNLSLSKKDNGGSYSILNPFGNVKITGFSLTAVPALAKDANGVLLKDKKGKTYTPVGAKNSDFTLSRVEVTKVPEPTTVLGLGVVGLVAFARRRSAVKAD